MGKICISVAARKGGVGKTTIACSLASIFAQQANRVLLIDLDPQSNSAFALGVDPTENGTAELLMGEQPSPLKAGEGLFVLPGGPNLTSQIIQTLHPEDLADAVQNLEYDIVIYDCPPGNENLERLGLVAAEFALVVTNAHPFAIMGANRVLGLLESYKSKDRRGPTAWSLVISQVDERRALDKQLPNQLKEIYPTIEHFVIHQDTNLSQAGAQQTPLMEFAPKSRPAKELSVIASWILAQKQ